MFPMVHIYLKVAISHLLRFGEQESIQFVFVLLLKGFFSTVTVREDPLHLKTYYLFIFVVFPRK